MDNTCFVCDKSFSTASNLQRHARPIHNAENKVSICRQIKCNVCSASMKTLLDHVESTHNTAVEKETKKFDTYEAFKIWKEVVEKQITVYVKNIKSKPNTMGGKQRTYIVIAVVFNKIKENYPSKIKVCEDIENQVYVEFTKTNLGHGTNLGRKQITREENEEIA
ncbi:hypothetical protein NPIL_353171 [Nephila pilipes]|uniref:C2H2-type domain-containing protein n=1 Tax=Nephila pilipes TaxID=299642 RepID=A0A8X6UG43_NEPPI|nr:hypothetical protein NPIL_353171 [Nephila pilipes]